jgi:hypothetical protein
MTLKNELKRDPLIWLLAPDNPGVRYLALRDLCGSAEDDPELLAARKIAHDEGPIATILAEMNPEGYWDTPGPGYRPKYRSTVWSVIMLAQLGASIEGDERVAKGCTYVLDHALTKEGQFSITGTPSGTVDCLQGNLCWALLELGMAGPRLENAFEWMARTVTGEGISPKGNKNAEIRYYASKCGPNFACGSNNKLPCAWGAVKVMLAFSKLSENKRTPLIENAIQRGIDFLFSTDPAKSDYPAGFSDKPSRNWWKFGFPVFYVTDLLQNVEAFVGLGYGSDPRLTNALAIIREKQDQDGRWALEYDYTGKTWVNFGEKKQPNKWVTFRALRALKTASQEGRNEQNEQ